MISAMIGSSNAERDGHFPGAILVPEQACQEGAAFTADLFRRHLHIAQLPSLRLATSPTAPNNGSLMSPLTPARRSVQIGRIESAIET